MPTPVRPRDLQRVLDRYLALKQTARGGVLIVRGPHGSGCTALLRAVLDTVRQDGSVGVVGGAIAVGLDANRIYRPWESTTDESSRNPLLRAVEDALVLGSHGLPVLGLMAQLLRASQDARAVSRSLDTLTLADEAMDMLPGLLRAAAQDRPWVVVLDNAESADGLWRDLEWSFAREVAQDLQLLLVLTIHDDEPGASTSLLSDAHLLADSLIERGWAESVQLDLLGREDVTEWIGPSTPEIVDDLVSATWGRAAVLGEMWEDWVLSGAVERDRHSGRWEYTVAAQEVGFASALRRHLTAVLDDVPSSLLSEVRTVLGCAALEGRTFTAEAVAAALERPEKRVLWILDDVLATSKGEALALLEEGRVIGGTRPLWPYRFRSVWHWLSLRRDAAAEKNSADLASRLADALESLYSDPSPELHARLADLLQIAGRSEDAARHQRAADRGGDEELRARVQAVVGGSREGWAAWETRRAAELLLDAIEFGNLGVTAESLIDVCGVALELGQRLSDGVIQCQSHLARAGFALGIGDLTLARRDTLAGLRISEEVPIPSLHALAELRMAELLHLEDQPDDSERAFERALAKYRELGNPHGQFNVHSELGVLLTRIVQ